MGGLDDVRRLALSLPGVTESGPGCHGVGGKGLTWTWKERIHPKRPRVERLDVLGIRTVDVADKHALIATHPDACFTEPHYNGYPAVLVRLPEADIALLAELIVDAWRHRAPRALAAGFDAEAWLAEATAPRRPPP